MTLPVYRLNIEEQVHYYDLLPRSIRDLGKKLDFDMKQAYQFVQLYGEKATKQQIEKIADAQLPGWRDAK